MKKLTVCLWFCASLFRPLAAGGQSRRAGKRNCDRSIRTLTGENGAADTRKSWACAMPSKSIPP